MKKSFSDYQEIKNLLEYIGVDLLSYNRAHFRLKTKKPLRI
ncbi:MAG: hypothetical protein AAF901_05595 [Bacteroidota bacterium]